MRCPSCSAENHDGSRFCGNCATRLNRDGPALDSLTKTLERPSGTLGISPPIYESGQMLAGKYRIIEPVGKGGMGIVYKAEDTRLERVVALKFLPSGLMEDAEARERFIREARAAAALSHPHICTVYEINGSEQEPFIAMEFIGGRSLKQRIAGKRLTQAEAVDLAVQLAEGLEEAHKKGIVHRDIKPGNIMLTERGQAKITDFGLAKVLGGSLITKQATTMGTVAYMSPEQAQGRPVDYRTDLWSLGVVIYEMLTGDLPFRGERETSILYSVVHEEPASLKEKKPPIPQELERIIDRTLRKDPGSRYQSASELLKDLRRYQDMDRAAEAGVFNWRSFSKRIRQPKLAIPSAIGLAALGLGAFLFFSHQAKVRWARNILLPEIATKIAADVWDRTDAGELAIKAEKYLAHDPKLAQYISETTIPTSIETKPEGAKIYMKKYKTPESEWQYVGLSPIKDLRLPIGFFTWKLEKEGYETVSAASPTFFTGSAWGVLHEPYTIARILDKKGDLPPGMVRVTGGPPLEQAGNYFENSIAGRGELDDFFIDQYEVTNRQYKEFVDKGGYQQRAYWREKFFIGGKELAWEDALKRFVDQMGQPGPSTWQAGDYPDGQGDYPVSGVSWYEAAAYAESVGKSLPTASHWGIARGAHTPLIQSVNYLDLVAPLSNFATKGPAPVGSYSGMTSFGAYDMAGNVREWCWNEAPLGRIIRGGAWKDTPYMFSFWSQAPAFDRSSENGFRCALYPSPEKIPREVFSPCRVIETEDFSKGNPVPDAIFQVYKEMFSPDKAPLNAVVEWRNEDAEDWIQEKVTFDAAYENERMIGYLFLPKTGTPPYQSVIHLSGASEYQRSASDLIHSWDFEQCLSFIIKSGRAVLVPACKGTFERGNDATTRMLDGDPSSRQFTEINIKIISDLKRSIDYLETRPELDHQRVAYGGFSFGALLGPILLATDNRVKAAVLQSGGFFAGVRQELALVNYLSRVKVPTLMLNGRYDLVIPYETNSRLMFELLGGPKEQKVFDCAHIIPRNDLIRETLAWLDKYLGPVK
jgi:serine/threonine protein kinase/formylglycine-generating enzyme required for sulfatase activity/dienelactone hydrolase